MTNGNAPWDAHMERLTRIWDPSPKVAPRAAARSPVVSDAEAEKAARGEWNAIPPGPLGRRLLADIEPYLAFFAIAHA